MLKKALYTTCLLAAGVPLAQGAPVFGCSGGSACNGNQYEVFEVSHVGNTYVIQLDIKVLNSYTGNLTDYINSVSLKDFVSSWSNDSLISAPGGVGNWTYQNNELNANGCA